MENLQKLTLSYFFYVIISGFLFYAFFFIISLFGYTFFKIISKKSLKKQSSIILLIFFYYGLGLSIYLSFSTILLIFNIFNFITAYLPFLIIDITFTIYKIKQKGLTRIKNFLNDKFIKKIKYHSKDIIITSIFLTFIFLLQYNFQWLLISQAKSLLFKDPFSNLANIYFLLDTGTANFENIGPYYPPGFSIFCSGNLLISNDYVLNYYFLKFSSIHLLSLFLIFIYFMTFKIFKRYYISLLCSILLLCFFLFSFRVNAFLSLEFAIIIISISLIIFTLGDEFRYLLGFFISLVFLINPISVLYFIGLLIPFLCFKILFYNFKEELKTTMKIGIIVIVMLVPYLVYLQIIGINILEIIYDYFNLIFQTTSFLNKTNNIFILSISNIDEILLKFFENLFHENFNFIVNLHYSTTRLFILITGIGLLCKIHFKNKYFKNIQLLCKLSVLIIIFSFISPFSFAFESEFYNTFHIRVFQIYSPLIIILAGFGIKYLEIITKKIDDFIKGTKNLMEKKIFKTISIIFNFKNFIIILLFVSVLNIHFDQRKMASNWMNYYYNDEEIDAYFYLRQNVPKDSKILVPFFSHSFYGINSILYDMEIQISPFNISTILIEFEPYIIINGFNYLLLDKSAFSQEIFSNLSTSDNFEQIWGNEMYNIYKVLN